MATLKLYNTLTRSIEDFVPQDKNKVTIYHCGPTVYWTQHIGNMRAMYFGDIVRRTLKYLDYNPVYTRNYTDVGHLSGDNEGDADSGEDRMEKGAKREGITVWDIAEKYIKQFDNDISKLGNLKADFNPRATECIEEQIAMVQELLDKDYAYITEEAVYFDVSKAKDYNKLNKQKLEENIEGAGHGDSESELKRNSHDFAIWFFNYGHNLNHTMHWPSPFATKTNPDGKGFPGWHIECSAMAKKYLGETIDIHIGGVEHISVHHTNEIAQSESANQKTFVNYWLHNEHLLIDGGKMSKSLGNVYSIEDIENKGFSALDLRYFFLNAHYKSQQNFTWESLNDAKISRERLKKKYEELSKESKVDLELNIDSTNDQKPYKKKYQEEFANALSSDFNTSIALSVIWKMLKDEELDSDTKFQLLNEWNEVLGIQIDKEEKKEISDKLLAEINLLISQRNEAKQNKDYKTSDDIREKLILLGVEIKDTAEGTKWKLK